VNLVAAAELGPGAFGLLEHYHILKVSVKHNTKVADVMKENVKIQGLNQYRLFHFFAGSEPLARRWFILFRHGEEVWN
jgi:predicted Fe-Mo cluster-binding NifX family protein